MLDQQRAAGSAHSASPDDAWYAAWRRRELARIDAAGITYLDYTGAALYPASLVREDAQRLEHACLGNPHSVNGPSLASTDDMESARAAILGFLHASPQEYAVILTANASGGCRLVGESFPFRERSILALAADNHNSVNGLREYARRAGATTVTMPLTHNLRLADPHAVVGLSPAAPSLVAFPAQSNFSGVRHPLSLVADAQARGWRVLLDAAAFLPTAELRLDRVRPDFLVLSLYKIAGYPTGVGALVARHDALALLRRPTFAGGSVRWVSVAGDRHRLIDGPEGFEDGTPHFLALGAVPRALALIRDAGRERLRRHLAVLTAQLLRGLVALQHANGRPRVAIHGPQEVIDRGSTVALSLLTPTGKSVPYWEVEDAARAAGLAVRGGCFCNPGCAEAAFGLADARSADCLDRLGADFTVPRYATCLGADRGVGAIRLSLGLGSTTTDVDRALAFVREGAALAGRANPVTTWS